MSRKPQRELTSKAPKDPLQKKLRKTNEALRRENSLLKIKLQAAQNLNSPEMLVELMRTEFGRGIYTESAMEAAFQGGQAHQLEIDTEIVERSGDLLGTIIETTKVFAFLQGVAWTKDGEVLQQALTNFNTPLAEMDVSLDEYITLLMYRAYRQIQETDGFIEPNAFRFGALANAVQVGIETGNGSKLRNAVAEHGDFFAGLLTTYKNQTRPGPEPDIVISWLCHEAITIWKSEGCRQPEATEILFNRLSEKQRLHGLEGIEISAFAQMEEWEKKGGYSENLWRTARRRGLTIEEDTFGQVNTSVTSN